MSDSYKIFGIRAILEAIRAGKDINKVFLQKGAKGDLFAELEREANRNVISTSYVPIEKLNKLSKNKNHQGAVAQISPVAFTELEVMVENALSTEPFPIFLLLDGVSDVRNFGAIIRTSECANVSGIIVPDRGSAPINEDTVKTSAGAVFRVPICKVRHLKDAVYYLKSSGVTIVGASEKSDKEIYDVDLTGSLAIVMGAEDVGISPSMQKILDDSAKLPMYGEINSLNVSVAYALVVYEAIRQRRSIL